MNGSKASGRAWPRPICPRRDASRRAGSRRAGSRRAVGATVAAWAGVAVLLGSCTAPSSDPPPGPTTSATSAATSTVPGSSAPGSTLAPARRPEVRFGLATEPGSLDPIAGPFDRATFQVARALFDPLLAYDERLDLQPVLAESVTGSDDLRTWTITLRPGVRFSDGRAFDAGVVAGMLDRARTSQAFSRHLDLVSNIESVERHKVVVTLRAPWSTFPHVLAGQLGMVALAGREPTDVTGAMVGTGPFAVTQWDPGRALRVERVPAYWRGSPAESPSIVFRFVENATARSEMIIDGELDVALFDEPAAMADAEEAERRGAVVVHADRAGETAELVLALATDRPPFDEREARSALAHAIDRDALSRRVFNGQYPPAEGPFSEGSRWFGQAQWPVRDPNAARDDLKRRSSPEEPLRFELITESTPLNRRLVEELRYQLQEVGIDLEPIWMARPELRARTADWRFTAALVPLFDGQHPDAEYGTLHSRADGAGLVDTGIDESLEKARTAADITGQAESFQLVQEQLARELPFVFLVRIRNSIVTSPAVQDLERAVLPNGRPGLPQLRGTVALERVRLVAPAG